MLCSSAHILIHKTSWLLISAHFGLVYCILALVAVALLRSVCALFCHCMRIPSLFSGTHNQRWFCVFIFHFANIEHEFCFVYGQFNQNYMVHVRFLFERLFLHPLVVFIFCHFLACVAVAVAVVVVIAFWKGVYRLRYFIFHVENSILKALKRICFDLEIRFGTEASFIPFGPYLCFCNCEWMKLNAVRSHIRWEYLRVRAATAAQHALISFSVELPKLKTMFVLMLSDIIHILMWRERGSKRAKEWEKAGVSKTDRLYAWLYLCHASCECMLCVAHGKSIKRNAWTRKSNEEQKKNTQLN